MIFDHYHDKWKLLQPPQPQPYSFPVPYAPLVPNLPPITPADIEEFRKLLERAREYDRRTGQPDCELDEKKQKVKELAESLGVQIDFLESKP